MKLGAFWKGDKLAPLKPEEHGPWTFDEDDYLLYALLTDPITCAELLFEDPTNHDYGGAYVVRDYQYPLFRIEANYAGAACARSVGKTESIKARAVTHVFKRIAQNLLVTAPELIHLLPLTDAIEDRIRSIRLLREFLDTRAQKTGFTHRPFGVDFLDGTKIVGRIPRLTGTGVKGQHQPDLIIDEAQDYPEKGWIEVHECQPHDAPVLTPQGYRAMGDLAVGDAVIGVNGRATAVLAVHERGEKEVQRVTFSDGASVECDADHYWTVGDRRGRWQVLRAREIAERLPQRWALPAAAPVLFSEQASLGVDPYLVGVALGDGCLRRGALYLSVGDPELLTHVEPLLDESEELVAAGGVDYRLRKRGRRSRHGRPPLRDGLEALGLWGHLAHEKFIPQEYLTASLEERLGLLAGLVDTDGSVDSQGAIRFCTSSDRLARDVEFLVRSLGGELRRSEQKDRRGYRTMHVVRFRIRGVVPCRLLRKATRVRDATVNSLRRYVVAVEPTGETKPMRCIEVAAHDGLYLTDHFIPTHNTVMKENDDFTYHFYGVHSGARDTGFFSRASQGGFKMVNVTALMRPDWNAAQKQAAIGAYGSTNAPDYRRNILGEPGAAASPFFVTARLVACVDQDRDSRYNTIEYRKQEIRAEEFAELRLPMREVLDLPTGYKEVWGGMDIGMTESPSVITLWSREKVKGAWRLKLFRRIQLWRMRTREQRETLYAIAHTYGKALKGFGVDSTGIGFPLMQEMEDDEAAPEHLIRAMQGFFFNAKVPVGVDKEYVTKDQQGRLRDQFGAAVKEELDPLTNTMRYITLMPMIEASTRYLREFVDTQFMMLPFDTEITSDMQAETQQRVKRIAGLKNKPNAFHILDSMRAMAMVYKREEIEAQLAHEERRPVLDYAL